MSLSMHSASVPIFVKTLSNVMLWLDKAREHAAAKKFDVNVLLTARLAPDMLPFVKQVQIACDTAKYAVARLASIEAPVFEDNETTLDQLKERIRKTIDYVQSVAAVRLEGAESREVVLPRRDAPLTLKGEVYLKHYALPNFFFHVTTAYALLRHNGVALGKTDFLGALQ